MHDRFVCVKIRTMEPPPFDLRLELPGWALFWARLEQVPGYGEQLTQLRAAVAQRVRRTWRLEGLASHPTVAALRKLFRAAGCDPTRHRPSSEALLRRILKGEDLVAIHPLVDLNNCLSVELAVPCCALAEDSLRPPMVLRAGKAGEGFESLRGPFNLQGKPLLADTLGPLGTPITDSQRVKIQEETVQAWLVAYLPRGVVAPETAHQVLETLLRQAPVARVLAVAAVD